MLLSVTSIQTFGQFTATDSLHLQFARWFDHIVKIDNSALMNGELYSMYPKANYGDQFFKSKYFTRGTVYTSSQLYPDIMLLFDIENDQLILKHPDSTRFDGIQLNMEEIQRFIIHEHTFQRFSGLNNRIYDVLFQGEHISLLGKYLKELKTDNTGLIYKERTEYFIYYQKKLYPFKKFKSLKKLFPQYQTELKEYKRKHKVRFLTDEGAGRTLLIKKLDTLLK